tara:strand:- start:325 stop:522 length:198 start_codon:yes stop_codon:yes gene_type:complete
MRVVLLIKSIVAPILIALVYFIAILPIGIIVRLLGKDLLRQKFDKNTKSYWIERTKPMRSMKSQF